MADDRDKLVRKHPTPVAGVRSGTQNDDFEQEAETPVDGDPVTQINTRAKNAAANAKGAFAAIREVRTELRDAVKRDEEDHKRISNSMEKIEGKVDTLSSQMGGVRERVGEMTGHMATLIAQAKATIELDTAKKKEEIEDTAHIRKTKRELSAKVVMTILGAVGAILTVVVGLLKC